MKTIINLVILPPIKMVVFMTIVIPFALWLLFANKDEEIAHKMFDRVLGFKVK